jgi:phage terminase large subunit-like protein
MALAPEQRQLAEVERQLSYNQLYRYKPYPKQLEFHAAGGQPGVRDRLLIAGNQLGKTLSASRETAMHATGMYPDWWPGARFRRPTSGWVASLTSQGTRDTVQRLLMGPPGQWGTGAIPKKLIIDVKKATHGVADALETVMVRHEPTGGISRITLKTYDQGRERWQGDTLNYLWFDEEPPEDIYDEGLTRLVATGGISYMTFTPLQGMSAVVRRFLMDKKVGMHVTQMTIDDALHFTPEERAAVIARYPEHQRAARAMGKPLLGSGLIFPYERGLLEEPALQIPDHWPRICALDFGFDHPTAAVWIAWDRDSDTAHVYDTYRRKETLPVIHSAAIRARGLWIPAAWPHDGDTRDGRNSGETYAQQYRDLGVNMLKAKASHPPDKAQGQKEGDGGNSLETGLTMMGDRIVTGRLKVGKHLNDWWEEYDMYHRENGLVVKEMDDLMSATRIGLMMLRHAKVRMVPREASVRGFQPIDPSMGALG